MLLRAHDPLETLAARVTLYTWLSRLHRNRNKLLRIASTLEIYPTLHMPLS